MGPSSSFPWLNVVEYPFPTREFDTGDGWISYVDQGFGKPIVFVHGSLTWSYLFRRIIRGLEGLYRCVAPDHLGFGLSDKPMGVDYSPPTQARRFADLMDYLRLTDVTLVAQDYGGPIALSWALDNPDRVRQVVLFNSWMWSLRDNPAARRLSFLVGNPINRFYYRVLRSSPAFTLPGLFSDRHCLPKATQIQFMEPFRNHHDRQAVFAMVEGYRKSTTWFEELYSRRTELQHLRVLLLWGLKDPMFGIESMLKFQQLFPLAETVTFPHVGRLVPEEAPHMAVDEIRWFLMNQPALSPKLI